MKQYLITFISIIIILILVLYILLQQAQSYHKIIKEARKFANHKYFPKKLRKKNGGFSKKVY